MVSAGKKVVTVWVKRVVAIMTGFGGKLGRKDRQAKAAKKTKLVISIGKAIMRVLAGEVVKGKCHHGVGKGGEISADMGRGGEGDGKEVIVSFLEAAVDVSAKVGKLESAIGEIRKGRRGGGLGKVRLKEGGTS